MSAAQRASLQSWRTELTALSSKSQDDIKIIVAAKIIPSNEGALIDALTSSWLRAQERVKKYARAA